MLLSSTGWGTSEPTCGSHDQWWHPLRTETWPLGSILNFSVSGELVGCAEMAKAFLQQRFMALNPRGSYVAD